MCAGVSLLPLSELLNCYPFVNVSTALFDWLIFFNLHVDLTNISHFFLFQHGKHNVYNVSWNHKDSRRIASCSGDGSW